MEMNPRKSHTDSLLSSLDGIRRASAPDFFYTRLRARMEREAGLSPELPRVLRPVWVLGGLTLVLLFNGLVLLRQQKQTTDTASLNAPETEQVVAAEYNLSESSIYDLTLETK